MAAAETARGRAAFRHRDFRLHQGARLASILGGQIQAVGIGWHVYNLTGNVIDLGLVGLAQFLPFIVFALPGGHFADRHDRRNVLGACHAVQGVCALLLTACMGLSTPWPIYAVLACFGVARAFYAPASSALAPDLVPIEDFPNAVAWTASIRQLSVLTGPALGGILFAWAGAVPTFLAAAGCHVIATVFTFRIRVRTGRSDAAPPSWGALVAGLGYVWKQRLLLGCMSLDLFAVLLGGAVALLPVFAKDILHVGPVGLGLMRSAPAVGAGVTAMWLAHYPLQKRTGLVMLACVFFFGVATVVLGLSRTMWLSLPTLAILGATDMVSVVVRLTLEQLATPPSMRGRVSAVNMMFIGASNELGEFESGVTAAWWGAVPAVIVGGIGTCLVVLVWSVLFPELRRVNRLDGVSAPQAALIPQAEEVARG